MVVVAPVTSAAPASAPRGVARARPRVVPKGPSDDELLEAGEWRVEGMPAVSRDGKRVASVFREGWGYRALVDEQSPNFDEPNGIVEYPHWAFVVVDAGTGAVERREVLVHSGELGLAQRQGSKAALAARVRQRFAEVDRFFDAGKWDGLPSVELEGRTDIVVEGVRARLTAGRFSVSDPSGGTRLDVALGDWSAADLPVGSGFSCRYSARIDELAVDRAHAIVVLVVGQDTNGGDACSGASNADRAVKVLRLGEPR